MHICSCVDRYVVKTSKKFYIFCLVLHMPRNFSLGRFGQTLVSNCKWKCVSLTYMCKFDFRNLHAAKTKKLLLVHTQHVDASIVAIGYSLLEVSKMQPAPICNIRLWPLVDALPPNNHSSMAAQHVNTVHNMNSSWLKASSNPVQLIMLTKNNHKPFYLLRCPELEKRMTSNINCTSFVPIKKAGQKINLPQHSQQKVIQLNQLALFFACLYSNEKSQFREMKKIPSKNCLQLAIKSTFVSLQCN